MKVLEHAGQRKETLTKAKYKAGVRIKERERKMGAKQNGALSERGWEEGEKKMERNAKHSA